jgi:hypothetical protein
VAVIAVATGELMPFDIAMYHESLTECRYTPERSYVSAMQTVLENGDIKVRHTAKSIRTLIDNQLDTVEYAPLNESVKYNVNNSQKPQKVRKPQGWTDHGFDA